jgi:catechol 2,3-dioxygenase-like lactoylglutathione lyase family enzyme
LCYRQMCRQEWPMPPKTDGILESSLYVSDLLRSVHFYEETFGFSVISELGERGCAMYAGTHQVLLLFKKGASRMIQSPHDGERRVTRRVRYPSRRAGQLGVMAQQERNRSRREEEVGIGRLEPLLSRPGPPFSRTRHAGHMAGLLSRDVR